LEIIQLFLATVLFTTNYWFSLIPLVYAIGCFFSIFH
jgi:hypothetical protein